MIDLAKLNRLEKKHLRKFNLHRIYPQTLHNLGFKSIAFRFKDFRIKRNDADYDLDLTFNVPKSRIIVNEIEKLMINVKQL